VVDGLPIDAPVARHQRLERDCCEIVGAHGRQRAAEAADGGADIVADVGFSHHAASAWPWAFAVRALRSRSVLSSRSVGAGVSSTTGAKRTGQPQVSCTSARVTPGWSETTVNSFVTGSGFQMARSVISSVGPLVVRPSFSRASPPVPWPKLVKKSIFSTMLRL